jgi:O-antigen/teichoic acid export membrane protein
MIKHFRGYLALDGLGPTLVRAMAGSAGIRIVGMAFGFLVGIQLARGLGAAGYGVYGVAMSIISLIAIPTEFGLPQLVTREVSAAQTRNDSLLIRGVFQWANRTVIFLSLGMATVGLIVWIFFEERFSEGVAVTLLVGLPLVTLVALGKLRGAAMRGLQQIVRGQVPEVILRPAIFSLLLMLASVLIPSGLSPTVAISMQVTAAAIVLIIATNMLRDFLPATTRVAVPATRSKVWLRSALPMAITEGMRILHGNVSILILGVLAHTATVGVFRVATSMGTLLNMPVALINIVSAPIFSRLHAVGDKKRLQLMLSWIAVAMVIGVATLTLPFLILGPELLIFLFGIEFGESNTPLLVLSFGTIIGSTFGAGATLLNMTGHEKRVARAFCLSLLALLLFSPLFIHLWGAVGAALANSLAYILWCFLMWFSARRQLQLDTSIVPVIRDVLRFGIEKILR